MWKENTRCLFSLLRVATIIKTSLELSSDDLAAFYVTRILLIVLFLIH